MDTADMEKKSGQDPERLLREGRRIQLYPRGYSMYPFICPGKDAVILAPVKPDSIRRGDVVLYRRQQGILVLHRVWRADGQDFYLVGDNQSGIEGPVGGECVLGRMEAVVRGGRERRVSDFWCRRLALLWLRLRPLRPFLSRQAACFRRMLRKLPFMKEK